MKQGTKDGEDKGLDTGLCPESGARAQYTINQAESGKPACGREKDRLGGKKHQMASISSDYNT